MQYIQGINRNQAVLFPRCLDELVDSDNDVRIIDLFVDSINLEDYKLDRLPLTAIIRRSLKR